MTSTGPEHHQPNKRGALTAKILPLTATYQKGKELNHPPNQTSSRPRFLIPMGFIVKKTSRWDCIQRKIMTRDS